MDSGRDLRQTGAFTEGSLKALDIKICGLSTEGAVETAIAGGATHLGFIFFAPSPRDISPARAAQLSGNRKNGTKIVAVTVDAPDEMLDSIVETLSPDLLQLHGKESPLRLAEIKSRHGLPVMKAFAIREAGDLAAIEPYRGVADRFLFDAKPPKNAVLPGGNGVSFDWELLAGLDPEIDYMLSGGIGPGNVAGAVLGTGATGVDVSSGVESAPGVKDETLIRKFIVAAREAETRRGTASHS